MNRAEPLPLRFQIGARTLAAVERQLVRVPLSLGQVLDGEAPTLPPLSARAHGYLVTSLPAVQLEAVVAAAPGMIAQVRQRYTRHYADLGIGFDAYQAALSGNTRSGLKRKTRRVMEVSGGLLDVRRFRTPEEMQRFHDIARGISRRTYQERLLGGGLPEDAAFLQSLHALAAAGLVRAWLLCIAGEPAAYLYCPVAGGIVRYDHVGHDPAFNDLSPGAVLMLEAMRDLYTEPGLTQFDFTEGDGQHKRSFATHGVACLDLLLLRPSLANRATMVALDVFDRSAAWGKRAVARLGLEALAKRVRR
ncbi:MULTISPECIES: GNAT family N-acetyltransferase [Sphingomonas]|jgi:CelD/BcsL family acetyltransferase involved in cellulose biosynthesis|uniref:GNAT family N-acetyltransferase n=1 Tax=Sphingomonas TaxID=13687 RepID=UPI001AE3103C